MRGGPVRRVEEVRRLPAWLPLPLITSSAKQQRALRVESGGRRRGGDCIVSAPQTTNQFRAGNKISGNVMIVEDDRELTAPATPCTRRSPGSKLRTSSRSTSIGGDGAETFIISVCDNEFDHFRMK